MIVLALETTADVCSAALGGENSILTKSSIVPRRHSQLLLKMIDGLVDSYGVSRSDIEMVGFSAGPGSFTGVRFGAAVAQGIAVGIGIDIVGVPTSDVFAHRISKSYPDLCEFTLQRKSRKGWSYVARYRVADGLVTCVMPDRLVEDSHFECQTTTIREADINPNAADVLELTLERWEQKVPPHRALPMLVDGDTPYRPRVSTAGK